MIGVDFPHEGRLQEETRNLAAAKELNKPYQDKDWERLPDGRVVIEIFGSKLALLTTADSLKNTSFRFPGYKLPKTLYPNIGDSPTLGDAITYYAEFRRLLDTLKQEPYDSVSVMVSTLSQNRIPPDSLPREANNSIGFYHHLPSVGKVIHNPTSCFKTSEPDKYGFVLEEVSKSPNTRVYCLPAEKRLFETPHVLRIRCVDYDNVWVFASCSLPRYQGGNKIMYAGFKFYGNATDVKEETYPKVKRFHKPEWLELDKNTHAFLDHILLTETKESIQ